MRRRLSRPCYDKAHRCPGWAGGGVKYAKVERCGDGHIGVRSRHDAPGEYIHPREKPWRFGTCDKCNVMTWPVAWTRLAPANLAWGIRRWPVRLWNYGIYDWGDVAENLWRYIGCPILGHRWGIKMYVRVCRRCCVSTPVERDY